MTSNSHKSWKLSLLWKWFPTFSFQERGNPPLYPCSFPLGDQCRTLGKTPPEMGSNCSSVSKIHLIQDFSEQKKQYLEVNNTFGVAPIRLPMLCLVDNALVWTNVYHLKINPWKKIYQHIFIGCNTLMNNIWPGLRQISHGGRSYLEKVSSQKFNGNQDIFHKSKEVMRDL